MVLLCLFLVMFVFATSFFQCIVTVPFLCNYYVKLCFAMLICTPLSSAHVEVCKIDLVFRTSTQTFVIKFSPILFPCSSRQAVSHTSL